MRFLFIAVQILVFFIVNKIKVNTKQFLNFYFE